MTNRLLAVDGLRVNYGAVDALRDVALSVVEGEIVTVIGANGAGKTTLMKTIVGLLPARAGTVKFADTDITNVAADRVVRTGLTLVPEGRQVFARMTVRENLVMGAYGRGGGVDEADIERSFTIFPRLRERQHQRAGTLSGGEQQMLAIARGLMLRPRLLLLDEPSLGLAPRLVRENFEVIRNLPADGTTIFMVEQMARMALKVSDRAYVLEHGRIVRDGTAADLLRDPHVVGAYLGAGANRNGSGEGKARSTRATGRNPAPFPLDAPNGRSK